MGPNGDLATGLQWLAPRVRTGAPAPDADKENLCGWGRMEWQKAPCGDAWPRPDPPQGCLSPTVGHGEA